MSNWNPSIVISDVNNVATASQENTARSLLTGAINTIGKYFGYGNNAKIQVDFVNDPNAGFVAATNPEFSTEIGNTTNTLVPDGSMHMIINLAENWANTNTFDHEFNHGAGGFAGSLDQYGNSIEGNYPKSEYDTHVAKVPSGPDNNSGLVFRSGQTSPWGDVNLSLNRGNLYNSEQPYHLDRPGDLMYPTAQPGVTQLSELDLAMDSAGGATFNWNSTDKTVIQKLAGVFDADYYLNHNDDVIAAVYGSGGKLTAWDHYVMYGEKEGRAPNALFNAQDYYAANPDVAASGASALQHYDLYGANEGRNISLAFAAAK